MISTNKEVILDLLNAFQSGDDKSFSKLYDIYADVLFNYGCCLTQDKELIKDCIHDVFIKLYTKRAEQKINNVSSYLFVSLKNRLLDEFRRRTFMSETPAEDVHNTLMDQGVETEYLKMEKDSGQRNRVSFLLNNLTPRQREAFTLYYIEERKYDEICDIMNMNYHSVRNLVHRGMLKLREVVK